jgi:hypothetical protein
MHAVRVSHPAHLDREGQLAEFVSNHSPSQPGRQQTSLPIVHSTNFLEDINLLPAF